MKSRTVDSGPCAFGMLKQFLADPTQPPDDTCIEQFKFEFMTRS